MTPRRIHPPVAAAHGRPGVKAAMLIAAAVTLIVTGLMVGRRSREVAPALPDNPRPGMADAVLRDALDQSIKVLAADPTWRAGFANVPIEGGHYSVRVSPPPPGAPSNYLRIVASGEVGGVTREMEALWVDATAAFRQTYAAVERVDIGHSDGAPSVALGPIHCNAQSGGGVTLSGRTTVYGAVTCVGPVAIGTAGTPAQVVGGVAAAQIQIAPRSEIRRSASLRESDEGLDLNGDGDALDFGVALIATGTHAADAIHYDQQPLADGSRHRRIAGGQEPVAIGGAGVGPIVDPHPDFVMLYELATGLTDYPPPRDHVYSDILGDGDGHYFTSSATFVEWLRFHQPVWAWCWRCAGEGAVGPDETARCLGCDGTGRQRAIEVTGVFYIDDVELELGSLGANLIVHGSIFVAQGNPYAWNDRSVSTPSGERVRRRVPDRGRLRVTGPNRMHVTITYRSDEDGGSYVWTRSTLRGGRDAQTIAIPAPVSGHVMRDYPSIVAAEHVLIEPRRAGFAYHPGDVGDERMTLLQGVIYSAGDLTLHGDGGWRAGSVVFDEEAMRAPDDELDESVLNIDLNDDGDVFDRVELAAISAVPVIRVGAERYNVDINSDGILGNVEIGVDYASFFMDGGHHLPFLVYVEGVLLGRTIHSCEQTLVLHDARIIQAGIPFAFEVSEGADTYQGIVSLRKHDAR